MLPSIDFNLSVLNLWIAMTKCFPRLPQVFGNDYSVLAIEPTYSLSEGKVNPELAVGSSIHKHLIFLESKMGPNLEEPQLQRNMACSDYDWEDDTGFPCDHHDVIYACKHQHEEAISNMLEHYHAPFPLQLVNDHEIRCRNPERVKTKGLQTELEKVHDVHWELVPAYIPVDIDSRVDQIVELLLKVILDTLVRGDEEITIEEVCQDIWMVWDDFSASHQKPLRRKIREMVKLAEATELEEFMAYGKDSLLLDPGALGDDKVVSKDVFEDKSVGKAEASVYPRYDRQAQKFLARYRT